MGRRGNALVELLDEVGSGGHAVLGLMLDMRRLVAVDGRVASHFSFWTMGG